MLAHIHPSPLRFTCRARPEFNGSATPARRPKRQRPTTLQSPTDSLGVDSQPLGHVFLVDTFCNLCFDIHPVLLLEHRLPPDLLGVSEGIPSCSLRGTFYFGVLDTFITGGDTLSGCYLARGGVYRYLERHYPLIIAHTGSCTRPKPSRCLRSPYTAGLCRLSPVPAGRWPFPTLSPRVFPQVPGPLPRWDPMVHMPVPTHRTSAFPTLQEGRLPL